MGAVKQHGYELIPYIDLSTNEFSQKFEESVNGKDPVFSVLVLEQRWSRCITLDGNDIEKEVDLNRKYLKLVTYRLALVIQCTDGN